TTPTGLRYIELKTGDGPAAKVGDFVDVHYTASLASGARYKSTYEGLKPERFRLGMGRQIAGLDEGVEGMKQGGKRKVIIPAELGYGKLGFPPEVPGNMDLVYEVELVAVNPKGATDALAREERLPESPELSEEEKAKLVTTKSGLKYIELKEGEGREAK